jgi:uncharacterized protein (UPF0332 family)
LAIHLHELSEKVPQELKEASCRTCVSRAYYAVFLLIRDPMLGQIQSTDFRESFKRSEVAHAVVVETVKKIDYKVGNFILNLRRLRNEADYETDKVFSPSDVSYALRIAGEVIRNLAMTISKIHKLQERDILSTWKEVQEKRARKKSQLPI